MSREAVIALSRFGMGPRFGEVERLRDPVGWLERQLRVPNARPQAFADLRSSLEYINAAPAREAGREGQRAYRLLGQTMMRQEIALRYAHAFETGSGFYERLTRFWSNHFTVSARNRNASPYVGAFEREAIRPHVTSRFEDMLLAVVRHPAMLIYLDNANSFGPNSTIGRRRGIGLNENLAREILELHTLGVDGGYSQDDVIALARIITGWTVNTGRLPPQGVIRNGSFAYLPFGHEPGAHTLLGKTYQPTDDDGQGRAALRDIAAHPSTARFIATKLAVHFIADEPPESSIRRLERVFLDTGGDLKAMAQALIDEEAAWDLALTKFRQPEDFVVAGMRALAGTGRFNAEAFVAAVAAESEALDEVMSEDSMMSMDSPEAYQQRIRQIQRGNSAAASLLNTVRALGQYPFTAPSPAGWPDQSDYWANPEAVLERLEWAHAITTRQPPRVEPMAFGEAIFGDLMSPDTRFVLAGAASPAQGAALVLASPEFQRR